MKRYVIMVTVLCVGCSSDEASTGRDDGSTAEDAAREVTADVEAETEADTEPSEDSATIADSDTALETSVSEDSADEVEVADTDEADSDVPEITTDSGTTDGDVIGTGSCESDEDCVRCAYGEPIASEADCYCVLCPFLSMGAGECEERATAWQDHCTQWALDNPCPIPACLHLPPPICDPAGACLDDPYACQSQDDCTHCQHTSAPASPEECECPTCGGPLTIAECQDNAAAVAKHCEGLLDDCIPPPCVPPPPITCTFETFECRYHEGPPQ